MVDIDAYKKIVVLTGAGISVASGLNTYRGINSDSAVSGDVQHSGHVDRIDDDPAELWAFYGPLRENIKKSEPNDGHLSLSKLERGLGRDQSFCLMTQNVDGLHLEAGSKNLIELHGNIEQLVCSNTDCKTPFDNDVFSYHEIAECQKCGAVIRPNIVLFGEAIPVDTEWRMKKAMRGCDLFVAIGTSGSVSPASNIVRSAHYEGARTILLNLEPMEPKNPYFMEEYLGQANVLISQLFDLHDQN